MKSLYQIKRDWPHFAGGIITPRRKIYEDIVYEEQEALTVTERFAKQEKKYKDGEKIVVGASTIYFAEIAGGYEKQVSLLINKFIVVMGDKDKTSDCLALINCFDGALHGVTDKKLLNVTSYSSSIVSGASVEMGITPASTSSILTWKQVVGDEKMCNVVPAVTSMYQWLGNNVEKDSANILERKVHVYEVHDGKMIYALTAHSLWNRQHHPFLLCSCQRGDGVVDPNHQCTIISDAEHERLFDKSLQKFLEKKAQFANWNEDLHRAYADKNLKGCTHFGFDPNDLRYSWIRFDVFHLRAAMTRKLCDYLRTFMFKQCVEVQIPFYDMILRFWGEFKVSCWMLDRPLAIFKGAELLVFIQNIPQIQAYLRCQLENSEEAQWIVEGLGLWYEISPFLCIAHVKDKELYPAKMDKFDSDVKKFYAVGANTFLSTKFIGDQENFYSHVLRFYMPVFMRQAFAKHGTGLGIFTMQGFEHRNKESKRNFLRHTNKKGNVLMQVMPRLWDEFSDMYGID